MIGIGNVVRSDDAVGVHALRRLRERGRAAPGVELIEGGTAGLLLLPHIADARRVIVVDAIAIGAPAGTLVRLERGEGAFATGMTPHEVGLADLLDAARLTDAWPDELVVHGVQPGSTAIGTELTAPVAAALHGLVAAVEAELDAWRALCRTNGSALCLMTSEAEHRAGSSEPGEPLHDARARPPPADSERVASAD